MSSSLRHRALLSQNFLKDPALVATLLDRFDLDRESLVYEIGPGEGIITEQLARRFRRVVAVEKDSRLAEQLRKRFSRWPNVTIHAGDFLRYPLPHSPYKVFANIPFNITSAIVTKLAEAEQPPEDAYLTMQREAAAMFLGEPRDSLRSVLLKPWFETKVVHRFARQDFAPAPRVDVVMLRLRKRGPPLVNRTDRQYFRDFVVYLYTQWQPHGDDPLRHLFTRQQLRYLERALRFDPHAPPTSLSIEEWLCLFEQVKAVGGARAAHVVMGGEDRLHRQQRRLRKIHRTRSAGR